MSTSQIGRQSEASTAEQMRHELGRLSKALPALTKTQEDTTRALWAAQERVDAIDVNLWCGKPSGALKGALEVLKNAEAENARAKDALAANHRRRLELVQKLRGLVAA